MKFDKKNKFYIIVFGIITIACLWAFISAAVITKNFKSDSAANQLDKRKVTVNDLLLTETKDGKKYWEIFAEQGSYEDDEKIAYVKNSIGNFYEDDKVVASFQSPRATINSETTQIVMYDRSKLIYKDYTSIVADEFTYNGSDKPITAKGNVVIAKPNEFIITSDEAILSDEMTDIKVKGKVKTKVYGKGNK